VETDDSADATFILLQALKHHKKCLTMDCGQGFLCEPDGNLVGLMEEKK